MRVLLAIALMLMTSGAFAEPNIVTIPGRGWHLGVDVPSLTNSNSETDGARFSYTGVDTKSGITFSINIEVLANGSNAECRDEYWGKGQKNPVITAGTVEYFESPLLLGVSHRAEGDYNGMHFTTANAHGYFVKGDACVDLHVSKIGYSDESRARVENIIKDAAVID